MPGCVTRLLKIARHHRSFRVEPIGHTALRVMFAVAQKRGDSPTLGNLPGRYGHPRGRADRRIDVKTMKPQSFLRHGIDIRRFSSRIAKAGKVAPPHIVDQHHDDIGSVLPKWFLRSASSQHRQTECRQHNFKCIHHDCFRFFLPFFFGLFPLPMALVRLAHSSHSFSSVTTTSGNFLARLIVSHGSESIL